VGGVGGKTLFAIEGVAQPAEQFVDRGDNHGQLRRIAAALDWRQFARAALQ
jgi:hypothetical protein